MDRALDETKDKLPVAGYSHNCRLLIITAFMYSCEITHYINVLIDLPNSELPITSLSL